MNTTYKISTSISDIDRAFLNLQHGTHTRDTVTQGSFEIVSPTLVSSTVAQQIAEERASSLEDNCAEVIAVGRPTQKNTVDITVTVHGDDIHAAKFFMHLSGHHPAVRAAVCAQLGIDPEHIERVEVSNVNATYTHTTTPATAGQLQWAVVTPDRTAESFHDSEHDAVARAIQLGVKNGQRIAGYRIEPTIVGAVPATVTVAVEQAELTATVTYVDGPLEFAYWLFCGTAR